MVNDCNFGDRKSAIGNRGYTDKTRLRGLKAFSVSRCADIVCVDANSIRPLSLLCLLCYNGQQRAILIL